MTLFKKVFQSQARQAEGDETLDMEALRDATTTGNDQEPPLVLEPEDGLHAPFLGESYGSENDEDTTQDMSDEEHVNDRDHSASDDLVDVPSEDVLDDADKDEDDLTSSEPDLKSIMQQAAEGFEVKPSDTSDVDTKEDPAGLDVKTADDLAMEKVGPTFELCDTADEMDVSLVQPAEEDKKNKKGDAADFARHQIQVLQGGMSPQETAIERSAISSASDDMLERHHTDALSGDHTPERPTLAQVHQSATGRAARQTGRVKTRLLGFNRDTQTGNDPLDRAGGVATPHQDKYPVGWLVVIDGPGRGHAFSIFTGASMIGRGEDQMIRLDFGDTSISRQNHAAIAYDEEVNKFYVGHGGKSNIIRRNARPVLSTEELHHADLLRIGETTLRFVALCGSDFQWNSSEDFDATGV